MKLPSLITGVLAAALTLSTSAAAAKNCTTKSTYYNPVLPGWHSDPSCTVVGDTFYCATSTFIAFPGIPIYASKDLINWRLISHAWSRIVHTYKETAVLAFEISVRNYIATPDNVAEEILVETLENMQTIRPNT